MSVGVSSPYSSAGSPPTPGRGSPPTRPCSSCGRRDGWVRLQGGPVRGGWVCRCQVGRPQPILDAHGLPLQVMRHSCSRFGCPTGAELAEAIDADDADTDADEAAPP